MKVNTRVFARLDKGIAYSVVAFIVTVQLVEKSLNRKLGNVIVANLMAQYSKVVSRLRIVKMAQPRAPNTPDELAGPSITCAVLMVLAADAEALEMPSETMPAIETAFEDYSNAMTGYFEASHGCVAFCSSR